MKDEKDFLQNEQPEQNTEKQETPVEREKRKLTRRAVMVLVSGLIVVAVLVAVGIAWYTRIVNSYSVTFEVADYDLAINKNSDGYFLLDVYGYSQVTNKKMAPGTVGWLPLEISNTYGQVEVSYTIAVENLMPTEIAKHFRIFALKKAQFNPDGSVKVKDGEIEYALCYGEALDHEDDIYNATISAADLRPLYKKYYIDSKDAAVVDTIEKAGHKLLCIYWEWYWGADRAHEDHGTDGFTFITQSGEAKVWSDLTDEEKNGVRIRWDELDTDIGRYPAKYKDAMQMVVYGSGAQVKPSDGNKVTTAEETTTVAP